ncbi:hypothetical protein BDW22DRAFT_1338675, partial [Trametopsis cervina]
LIRHMWPHNIGFPQNDTRDILDMNVHQLVPETFDELARSYYTLRVPSAGGRRSTYKLAFTPEVSPGNGDMVIEPTFRFQGVVQHAVLSPMGNWNGNVMNCAKASQRLVLRGIADNDAFTLMQSQLNKLREYIYASLDVYPGRPNSQSGDHVVTFARDVFRKIHPRQAAPPAIVVQRMDDQEDSLARVEHMWRVVHSIRCGIQHGDGTLKPARHVAIRRGDFVDVAATVKVIMTVKAGRKDIRVYLEPQQVYRLRSATELAVSEHLLVFMQRI